MKKLIWLTLAVLLASCNSTSKEVYSGGSLSFSASEVKINVMGYFENAINKEGDPFGAGFMYEYSEDKDGISENFYTLSNYQNQEDKVRMPMSLWNFEDIFFSNDGTDLILNLLIENIGANTLNCSIQKVGDAWDEHYYISLPNVTIESNQSKTLQARISKLAAFKSNSINNGEGALLMFKAIGEKGELKSIKQSITKDCTDYEDLEREPASEVTGLIYGKKYTNMLGDMKKDTIFEKNYTNTGNINAFPHTDGVINNRETDATRINFIKDNYYFFAVDFHLEDFSINQLVTIQYHYDGIFVNDRPVYCKVTDTRIIIISQYKLDVTDDVFFAMCYSSKNFEDVGTITYHSMLLVDLGTSLVKTYDDYEKELTYFSISKSTIVDVIYIEGEVERRILRFTYTEDKKYISFNYNHKKNGQLVFRTVDGIEIDYASSYLTYSYYSYN